MATTPSNAEYRKRNEARRNAARGDQQLPSTILAAFAAGEIPPAPGPRQDSLTGERDEYSLADLARKRDSIERTIAAIVLYRRAAGDSWRAIADALGVSKQAAQQRYGK
ncbi:MAG: hypothetical protein JWP74_3670 [Marmoricola sp.]|nr:hypothetical protein [Marmoricola sp.]